MRSEAQVAGMPCPTCRTPLALADRQGVEIHYCPNCRGVWLDRGELDKIIERSTRQYEPAISAPPSYPQQPSYGGQSYRPDRRDDHGHKPHKRKKSFLEELFD